MYMPRLPLFLQFVINPLGNSGAMAGSHFSTVVGKANITMELTHEVSLPLVSSVERHAFNQTPLNPHFNHEREGECHKEERPDAAKPYSDRKAGQVLEDLLCHKPKSLKKESVERP